MRSPRPPPGARAGCARAGRRLRERRRRPAARRPGHRGRTPTRWPNCCTATSPHGGADFVVTAPYGDDVVLTLTGEVDFRRRDRPRPGGDQLRRRARRTTPGRSSSPTRTSGSATSPGLPEALAAAGLPGGTYLHRPLTAGAEAPTPPLVDALIEVLLEPLRAAPPTTRASFLGARLHVAGPALDRQPADLAVRAAGRAHGRRRGLRRPADPVRHAAAGGDGRRDGDAVRPRAAHARGPGAGADRGGGRPPGPRGGVRDLRLGGATSPPEDSGRGRSLPQTALSRVTFLPDPERRPAAPSVGSRICRRGREHREPARSGGP